MVLLAEHHKSRIEDFYNQQKVAFQMIRYLHIRALVLIGWVLKDKILHPNQVSKHILKLFNFNFFIYIGF